ncbi:MAG: S-adenosylmethionine:tRNA ribosyltransferase-isomerase [Acidimicrobiia bacterium]
MLIAAVLGERWRAIYDHALSSGYRFLSFGDAMFVEVPR